MNTYSITDIPTLDEVTAYFTEKGINNAFASLWYKSMQNKGWKNAKGKRIFNWQLYANYRINDLRDQKQANTKDSAVNQTLYKLAEDITEIHNRKTGKIQPALCKLYYELLSVLKYKKGLSEEQTVQAVHSALKKIFVLEDSVGFDYDFLFNRLETHLLTEQP